MREHKASMLKYLSKADLINEVRSIELDILTIKNLVKEVEMRATRLTNR